MPRPRRVLIIVENLPVPFDGRVWALQPDTYAMGVGGLVPCEDVPARHLGDYTLTCYRTPVAPA